MDSTDEALARLAAFAGEGEIAWPDGEGIDTAGDRSRGWHGPCLAGTYLVVADAGRNLADDWEQCREWYHDKTDEQCRAMRDYYLAHRDLFQAQAWREARYDQEYRPGGNREALQADVRALLTQSAALRDQLARAEAVVEAARALALRLPPSGAALSFAAVRPWGEHRAALLLNLREALAARTPTPGAAGEVG